MANKGKKPGFEDSAGPGSVPASRRAQLADEIADIVLQDGIGVLGLRGMAARVGTSDRMLIYYFGTKDQLIIEVLERVSRKLTALLTAFSQEPRVSPGQYLERALLMAKDPVVAPFMRLWTDVVARGARGEKPYDQVGPALVQSWVDWIQTRLEPAADGRNAERAAALLSIVEGVTLLEMAAPGSTSGVQAVLSAALDASADAAGDGCNAEPVAG